MAKRNNNSKNGTVSVSAPSSKAHETQVSRAEYSNIRRDPTRLDEPRTVTALVRVPRDPFTGPRLRNVRIRKNSEAVEVQSSHNSMHQKHLALRQGAQANDSNEKTRSVSNLKLSPDRSHSTVRETVCKKRPENNKPKKHARSGSKRFIPWCR